jgi:hypothetical protein
MRTVSLRFARPSGTSISHKMRPHCNYMAEFGFPMPITKCWDLVETVMHAIPVHPLPIQTHMQPLQTSRAKTSSDWETGSCTCEHVSEPCSWDNTRSNASIGSAYSLLLLTSCPVHTPDLKMESACFSENVGFLPTIIFLAVQNSAFCYLLHSLEVDRPRIVTVTSFTINVNLNWNYNPNEHVTDICTWAEIAAWHSLYSSAVLSTCIRVGVKVHVFLTW